MSRIIDRDLLFLTRKKSTQKALGRPGKRHPAKVPLYKKTFLKKSIVPPQRVTNEKKLSRCLIICQKDPRCIGTALSTRALIQFDCYFIIADF